MTPNGEPETGEGVSGFKGYPAPTSNTTYTPNQFFDVVLRHASRGTVRLVAYMIRKTLGWSDAQGNPQEPQVVVSYRQLVEEAGISRGAIQPSIEEAVAGHFIRCIRKGHSSSSGVTAVSALYELCWDESGEYITAPRDFRGFFAGNGNLTYIPNPFLDYTVPREPLAVVKVVGAIIRHTIGFQTKFGFRRQEIAMSFTGLQHTTGIVSRRALNDAIQYALCQNHLQRVEEGVFDPDAGQASKAATYAVKWCDTAAFPLTGSKRIPEIAAVEPSPSGRPVQKGYRHRFKKDTGEKGGDRFKKDTGTGSKRIPAPVQEGYRERSKKDTDIEITLLNNTSKQQQPVVADGFWEACEELKRAGFDGKTAEALAGAHGLEDIVRQIAWLPRRNPSRNPLGLLRKSIEQNWPAPELTEAPSLGAAFAAHFYAAWAGNDGAPVAAAARTDVTEAERFVRELLRHYPDEAKVPRMARAFGAFVREKEAGNTKMPRSLRLALTRHADAFLVDFGRKVKQSHRKTEEHSRGLHFARYQDEYFAYVRERAEGLRTVEPRLFAAFEEEERRQREALVNSPFFKSAEVNAQLMAAFDNEREYLKRFHEFFHAAGQGMVSDFWTWDRTLNPNAFSKEGIHT